MKRSIRKILEHQVFKNTIALYVVQIFVIVVPLISIPYLSRVLKTESFTTYMYCLSIATWFSLLIGYGFNLSATRSISSNQRNTAKIQQVVEQVQSAKLLLTFFSILVVSIFFSIDFGLELSAKWIIATIGLFVVLGFRPSWYFQGTEKMAFLAILEVISGLITLVLIFVLVKKPEDGALALLIYGMSKAAAYFIGTVLMYMQIGKPKLSIKQAKIALNEGVSMFIFTASVSLYTTANGLILGIFTSAMTAGAFLSAEKISKAGLSLLGPISQAIFPRINSIAKTSPEKARKIGILLSFCMGGIGLLGAYILHSLAPQLVNLILGPGYESVIPILKVLSLLIPLVALSNVFGVQYLLPNRKDKLFNRIIISAGIINLILAITFASEYKGIGMAYAVIVSEAFVMLMMLCFVLKNKFKY